MKTISFDNGPLRNKIVCSQNMNLRINFPKLNSCNSNSSSSANDLRFAGDVKDKNFDLRIIKRKENVFL